MAKQSVAAFLWLVVLVCILLCLSVATEAENGIVVGDHENEAGGDLKKNEISGDYLMPTWCIAKPSTEINRLQINIDECCKLPEVDCSVINPGGSCYDPQNYASHASMAMNLYYKAFGNHYWNCDFAGSGLIITQDPSWGPCVYPAA